MTELALKISEAAPKLGMKMDDELIDTEWIAKFCKYTQQYVRINLVTQPNFPSRVTVLRHGAPRWWKSDFLKWIESSQKAA